MTTAVVVPTNRPERIEQFWQAWREDFTLSDVRLIVVEDGLGSLVPPHGEVYAWEQIDSDLGERAACIPRRSGGCRDFGFWLAGQDPEIEVVIELDDDVLPTAEPGVFVESHRQALSARHALDWHEPVPGFRLRGQPYHLPTSPTMLNAGSWQGFPDVDALAQLQRPDVVSEFTSCRFREGHLARGVYTSVCGMNVAIAREALPCYWFPVLPDGYRRWDDIWAGLVFKRVADLHGWAVSSGWPAVRHDRASLVANNLKQEMLGYGPNERVWQVLGTVPAAKMPLKTFTCAWHMLGRAFPELEETARLAEVWAGLWPDKLAEGAR